MVLSGWQRQMGGSVVLFLALMMKHCVSVGAVQVPGNLRNLKPEDLPDIRDARVRLLARDRASTYATCSIADSTSDQYRRWVRRWCDWCEADGKDFLLTAGPWDQKGRSEEDLLLTSFIVYWSDLVGHRIGSIEQSLAAITWIHAVAGIESPTLGRPRLALVKKALSRKSRGEQNRKLPASPEVVGEAVSSLTTMAKSPRLSAVKKKSLLARAAAITVGWAFLLRRSEFLPSEAVKKLGRGLRLEDIRLFPATDSDPARVEVSIRGSKVDQLNLGCTRARNQFDLDSRNVACCPVRAVCRWMMSVDNSADLSSFAFHGVTPANLQESLREADSIVRIKNGLGPRPRTSTGHDSLSVHSLRAGGASALWSAQVSPAQIMREGRWLSQCYHRYLTVSAQDHVISTKGLESSTLQTGTIFADQ